jgi:lipopolysaccharide biosynthesis protein
VKFDTFFSPSRLSAYAQHVVQKCLSLTLGAVLVSKVGQRIQQRFLKHDGSKLWPDVRAAVVFHAYYPDLIPEALNCRASLPEGTPLIVTVPQDRYLAAEKVLKNHSFVEIYVVPNQGRDIAPFFMLLNAGLFDAYDAVLKIHSKRSPHLLDGEIRRKLLFQKLCGNKLIAFNMMKLFSSPVTGMVGWRSSYRKASPYWMGNEERVADIAGAMQAGSMARLGFFEGSMFWFRPAALLPLRRLNVQLSDFEKEEGQLDGMYHHALERCFTIAAWAENFEVRDVQGRLLTGSDMARKGA